MCVPMRVEFELDRADFAAFTAAVWRSRVGARLSWRRWALLGALLAIAIALGGLLTLVSGDTAWMADPVIVALLWAIAIVVSLLVLVTTLIGLLGSVIIALPPRDPAMLGWRAIELTDEGVIETTATGSELTRWDAIREVRETPAQILLFLSRISAHVIPKRAFTGATESTCFLALARAHCIGDEAVAHSSATGWARPLP